MYEVVKCMGKCMVLEEMRRTNDESLGSNVIEGVSVRNQADEDVLPCKKTVEDTAEDTAHWMTRTHDKASANSTLGNIFCTTTVVSMHNPGSVRATAVFSSSENMPPYSNRMSD